MDRIEQDEAAHRHIERSTSESLFVEAGAGTGKTSALVNRFIATVRDGTGIDKLVAITFTERAAAELKERVRSGLEVEIARSFPDSPVLARALESLDRAQISTIHSFCQSLLRFHAAEAGIDPDFTVMDEVSAERRRDEQWRLFLEDIASDPTAQSRISRLLALGVTTRELNVLATQLSAAADLATLMERDLPTAAEPDWPELGGLIKMLDATGFNSVIDTDRLQRAIASLAGLLERMREHEPAEREWLLPAIGQITNGMGRKENWTHAGGKDQAVETGSGIATRLQELLGRLRTKALADVLPYIVRFVRDDQVRRRRGGTLTFDDLIVNTAELLTSSGEVRAAIRNRFTAMMIDEFQDTDPMQVQIALSFATDPTAGAIEPGRLFLVGDPKQSIYRFRRADMAVYDQTKGLMGRSGARSIPLSLNRRSQPPVVDWVNGVFEGLIGAGGDPAVQPAYLPIFSERTSGLRGPGVAWFGDESPASAPEIRAAEAADVALICRQVIAERWQVLDRATRDIRPADYHDIAILIPTRRSLTQLERTLQGAGVPYRMESGSLIFKTQDVRDLINCLTAIDDPYDEVAIVAALRSPAFACSDRELFEFRQNGGRFNYRRRSATPPTDRVSEALEVLAGYHDRRHESSLAGLVEDFASERGLLEIGVLAQGDRNTFRRIRYVAEQARALDAAGPVSLRTLTTWLEKQADRQILDNEGAGLDDDEDAVRIQTIHGAKGLEYPIVILAGQSTDRAQTQYPVFLRSRSTNTYGVRIGTASASREFSVGNYDALYLEEQAHLAAEFDRVLYVAATRARDHLVVSLHRKAGSTTCGAARFALGGAATAAERIDITPVITARPALFSDLTVDIPAVSDHESLNAGRAETVRAARHRLFTSATALKKAGAAEDERPERSDESEPWSRGRAATNLGRAVHAAVQSIPWDADSATITAFSRAQATAEAIPHLADEVESFVSWIAFESEAWKRARSAQRALREVPFALQSGDVVLEGFIDMLLVTPDGLEIVDWKTDRISPSEVEDRLAAYRLQAGLYLYGIQQATGAVPFRVTYVFAAAGTEASPGAPEALLDSAIEALSSAT
jgi:ATP-dependent helicase/nuclease subunit A